MIGGVRPERVEAPCTAEEVRAVLADAARDGLGVVPLGCGTDPGCDPPSRPFVLLSTERMSAVEDYEPADLTVTAGAGCVLGDLAAELSAQGQWLPADPPWVHRRTLGGLVATGAAGPLVTSYGAPRDHVLGLTTVTGDGRVLKLGGRVMKNVAGFDLVKLMVGSRGTLGVVTSVTVRLFPRPAVDRAIVVRADTLDALVGVARAIATAALVPASAVLIAPAPEALGGAAALVVRLQGSRATVDADEARLRDELGAPWGAQAQRLDGEDAAALVAAAADHAADGELVVRVSTLPDALGGALRAAGSALPGAALAADVFAGRVRVSRATAEGVDTAALIALRTHAESLRGGMALERAPADLAASVDARFGRGRAGSLGAALRARFDPAGVLSPGRFAS